MSEEFYKYISNKLIDFFMNGNLNRGDKFFIELDEEEQVNSLYNNLKIITSERTDDILSLQTFTYQHNNGSPFETYSLNVSSLKIVVASSTKVTMDYLVTLRNAVGEQRNEWNNTVLLIIGTNTIDSIQNGMSNLQKEGMPLHLTSITNNLKNEINNKRNGLSKKDKECLKFYLDKKLEDYYESTIWDYEDVLGIINQGKIFDKQYNRLYLLPDRKLTNDLHVSTIRKRILENNKEFEKILEDHKYENVSDRLNKKYSDKGVSKLKKDDWYLTNFSDIEKYRINSKETIEYFEDESKLENKNVVYWEKPEKNTKAGNRKRHIIVFNNNYDEEIILKFKFDKQLYKKYINKNSQKYSKTSGKTLTVTIPTKQDETTFQKITYRHNDETKLKYDFNIAIVNCSEDILKSIKPYFSITPSKKTIKIISEDPTTSISFGKGFNKIIKNIEKDHEEIFISSDDTVIIDENSIAWLDTENLNVDLIYNLNFKIPFSIEEKTGKSIPTKPINVWKLKRENQENFLYNGSRIIQGVNSFNIKDDFKNVLTLEKQIISEKIYSGTININNIIEKKELSLSDELKVKYENILNYYKYNSTSENFAYPSLVYLNDELESLFTDFLDCYNDEINTISTDISLSENKNKLDLTKIGVFKTNNEIYFSSLSPISMAYQLEVKNQLKTEKLDFSILNRLSADNLIPYIYDGDEIYKPSSQNVSKEWIKYEKDESVNIGSTTKFIDYVVEEKLKQFVKNFSYLFNTDEPAPIKINLININKDKEIVKGIFKFIYGYVKDLKGVIPIELNIYNESESSYFDIFFQCNNYDELYDEFGLKINSKDLDLNEILHIVQNNITYYKTIKKEEESYEYAHISFYKIGETFNKADSKMDNIETGLYLNGLLSEITSFESGDSYKLGFGTKNLINQENTLIKTAIKTNELMLNSKNNGENTYSKGKTIIIKPSSPEEDDICDLYNKSIWVTFIEPVFGLEYFERNDDVIIVHYSDQYTSSNKYDTITVSDKNEEYEQIIWDFLKEDEDEEQYLDCDMNNILKIFNGINGEWLLRVISDNNKINREKLSVISALKYCLTLLHHEKIIWIPISMDELYRIAETIKIDIDDDLFKILKRKNQNSDFILFVGFEYNSPKTNVYYYPIEINNELDNIEKLRSNKNIEKIIEVFNSEIFSNKNSFQSKFLRNFIIQLSLANFKKLELCNLWNKDERNILEEIKPLLLNDNYIISNSLNKFINKGSIFAFKESDSQINITVNNEQNLQFIEVPKHYAFKGLNNNMDEIFEDLKENHEILYESLLCSNYEPSLENMAEKLENKDDDTNKSQLDSDIEDDEQRKSEESSEDNSDDKDTLTVDVDIPLDHTDTSSDDIDTSKDNEIKSLEEVRVLIGTINNSNEKIYWEYGNKQLGNRHLLILGKSGYGKTYFMQCLIKEMSKQNIPTVIIDYSDAFKNKELENNLKEYLGSNLQIYEVKRNKGFPLNPFRKNKIEYEDGEFEYEDSIDVASRIKSVFSSVYNLGIVQENTLLRSIHDGLEKYGSEMSFDKLMEDLENSDDKNKISLLNQFNEFLIFNPFKPKEKFEWKELDSRNGKVTIIQLSDYSKDIQKIITEFILWDLWNYKKNNGSINKPFNIILDEAQNLDYKSTNSPCVKILKEGRKFGWSAWFATQTVKSIVKNTGENPFNIAEQKIYFHPTDNVKNVAGEFTINNSDKEIWAQKLSYLQKGECISLGSTINKDGIFNSARPYYIKIDSLEDRQ